MTRTSVIVTTYNQVRYLEMVILCLRAQTETDFEVIVADDGSTEETAIRIASLGKACPFRIKHFWQPDRGFRPGEARNGAFLLAESDWIVFLDGDMLPHRRFVASHVAAAGRDRVLFGGRVKLNWDFSERLAPENLKEPIDLLYRRHYRHCREPRYDTFHESLGDRVSGALLQRFAGFYLPLLDPALTFCRLCVKTGCNFSVSRSSFERANGFDRRFVGLSGEDGELFLRFLNAGLKPHSVLFSAVAYHLWHAENWQRRGAERARAKTLETETRHKRKTRCEEGLSGPNP